jgi:hypothetical protein
MYLRGNAITMWPFKRKALKIEKLPVDGAWSVAEGVYNRRPMFVRTNTIYRDIMGVIGYEHQVGIAVPLRIQELSGLPSSEEFEELNSIEDSICGLLEIERESLFVAAISTGGMREFVFYTRSPELVKQKFQQLQSTISSHGIQLMIQLDRDWKIYKRLTKG